MEFDAAVVHLAVDVVVAQLVVDVVAVQLVVDEVADLLADSADLVVVLEEPVETVAHYVD